MDRVSASPAAAVSAPAFSMIEVEQEPTPAAEAAEVALLESLPDTVAGKSTPTEQHWAPTLKSAAEPIAASNAGQGAAAAPALAKTPEIKTAAPMASQVGSGPAGLQHGRLGGAGGRVEFGPLHAIGPDRGALWETAEAPA